MHLICSETKICVSQDMVDRKYDENLDPSLPQRKLYQNLRGLRVVNAPERLQVV
jgi:hypothetical protein